eukprot:UN09199
MNPRWKSTRCLIDEFKPFNPHGDYLFYDFVGCESWRECCGYLSTDGHEITERGHEPFKQFYEFSRGQYVKLKGDVTLMEQAFDNDNVDELKELDAKDRLDYSMLFQWTPFADRKCTILARAAVAGAIKCMKYLIIDADFDVNFIPPPAGLGIIFGVCVRDNYEAYDVLFDLGAKRDKKVLQYVAKYVFRGNEMLRHVEYFATKGARLKDCYSDQSILDDKETYQCRT